MSKKAFQGQNEAPAPAQGPEQISVHDRPAPKSAEPRKSQPSGEDADFADHGDKSIHAKRHAARQKDFPGDYQSGNKP